DRWLATASGTRRAYGLPPRRCRRPGRRGAKPWIPCGILAVPLTEPLAEHMIPASQTGPAQRIDSARFQPGWPTPPEGTPKPMPQLGPDQRSRNRRPRRRGQIQRAPVTEFEEQQELEAARERNDLDVSDLREKSVTELRAVSRDLQLETGTQERKDDLVERILERQTERAGHAYATGILDIVDEGFGFMRRHGLLPSPDDVYVSSSQVRRFGLRIGDRVSGAVRAPRDAEKYWGMLRVD